MLNGNDLITASPLGISYLKEMWDYCLTRQDRVTREIGGIPAGVGVYYQDKEPKKSSIMTPQHT